uniref:Uncharacterized protein n=1 Tax=Grammatophora oceanica TaxID=210454 RepID=A0A7S1USE5_9STRA
MTVIDATKYMLQDIRKLSISVSVVHQRQCVVIVVLYFESHRKVVLVRTRLLGVVIQIRFFLVVLIFVSIDNSLLRDETTVDEDRLMSASLIQDDNQGSGVFKSLRNLLRYGGGLGSDFLLHCFVILQVGNRCSFAAGLSFGLLVCPEVSK